MKQRLQLHVGAFKVQIGFWTKLYMWITGQSDVILPFNSVEFNGLDIELEGEVDPEVAKLQLEKGYQMLTALAKFAEPYVKAYADQLTRRDVR